MATTSQVVTSQLPTAFEEFYKTGIAASGKAGTPGYQPAVKGLIPQAFGLYGTGTPASYAANIMDPLKAANLYSGADRVAGLTPEQQSVGTQLSAMQTPGQFASGTGALGSGYLAASGLPSMLTPGQMQQYMSPYAQGVVDVSKQEAIRDAQKTQLATNLGAARQGTYGGARQLLATTERERNLQNQLGDIQAKGLQAAYEAGQKGLESERAARLQQAQTYGTLGQQFGQLGVAQQAADIDRLKTLGAYGDYERAVQQQKTDIDYQNLLQRIQYPEQQLDKLSGFIRGIPLTDTTTQTTTPPPSFASQLAGLGLSGLSLYNLMK
jgi:hypothetical protein